MTAHYLCEPTKSARSTEKVCVSSVCVDDVYKIDDSSRACVTLLCKITVCVCVSVTAVLQC